MLIVASGLIDLAHCSYSLPDNCIGDMIKYCSLDPVSFFARSTLLPQRRHQSSLPRVARQNLSFAFFFLFSLSHGNRAIDDMRCVSGGGVAV